MIIVIAIIGAITAIAVPRLLDKKPQTRKVFREFTVAGRDLRNRAKLHSVTYRLAFNLGEGSSSEQSWWVEKSNNTVLIDKKKYEAEREKAKSTFHSEEKGPPPAFKIDSSIFKKEQTLPEGFRFVQIESGAQDLIIKDGMAYIHFFPQGLIEPSAIQISDSKKNVWTLVFNPITGQSDIVPEARELKDLNR